MINFKDTRIDSQYLCQDALSSRCRQQCNRATILKDFRYKVW